jgi:validamycin A dioxygenase
MPIVVPEGGIVYRPKQPFRREGELEMSEIAIVDLAEWNAADVAQRTEAARELDVKLRKAGILELFGHGIPRTLRDEVRALSRPFFDLPEEEKSEYRVTGYGNGWRGRTPTSPPHQDEGPRDLNEVLNFGSTNGSNDAASNEMYYSPNKWPRQIPGLRDAVTTLTGHMERVATEVLSVLASALNISEDIFARATDRATWTLSVNWYPSLEAVGAVEPGQLRVGPHHDLGTISILDRQPGVGCLEMWHRGDWTEPPYHADSVLVLLGELMVRWTGGRWNAVRHRVKAPSVEAPTEELLSLAFFREANPDAIIAPLVPPVSSATDWQPVIAGEWMRRRVKEETH